MNIYLVKRTDAGLQSYENDALIVRAANAQGAIAIAVTAGHGTAKILDAHDITNGPPEVILGRRMTPAQAPVASGPTEPEVKEATGLLNKIATALHIK